MQTQIQMQMRMLRGKDAEAFREIRVRALRENPEFYPLLPEEVEREPLEEIAKLLTQPMEMGFVLGVFCPSLVAVAGLQRKTGQKRAHQAWIWGMYVAPEASGQGVGRAVLKRVIDTARLLPEVEQIHVQVVTSNTGTRGLYKTVGFETYGVQPGSLKVGEKYIDEEFMMLKLR